MEAERNKTNDLKKRSYQVRKKWSELSPNQKRRILADARFVYDSITSTTDQPMTNQEKRTLLQRVFKKIRSRGIWIPFHEVGRVVSSRIRKWNRRMKARQIANTSAESDENKIVTNESQITSAIKGVQRSKTSGRLFSFPEKRRNRK